MTKDLKLDHLIEEASEVIKAAIKIKRFGATKTNLRNLREEVLDVRTAYKRYIKHPAG
jgi:NTP pyrophosphatase (non-canonical NTP hydrolase)